MIQTFASRVIGQFRSKPQVVSDSRRDFTDSERAALAAVASFTMVSPDRNVGLLRAIDHIVRWQIPGDFVECGVWRGGTSLLAANAFHAAGNTGRTLWLYDTFEGMPPPEEVDRDLSGASASDLLADPGVRCEASLEDVRTTMARTAYPADRIRFVVGKVEDTIPATMPESIAILRLDTDWYASTYHELVHLYPRLVSGGILILDDYGCWNGARKAVDQYLEENRIPLFLSRMDYTGRIAVKP
jgi:hypothetical protein